MSGFWTRENLEFSQNAILKRLTNLERRLERAEKKIDKQKSKIKSLRKTVVRLTADQSNPELRIQKYACKKCFTTFTRRSSLKTHLLGRCKYVKIAESKIQGYLDLNYPKKAIYK